MRLAINVGGESFPTSVEKVGEKIEIIFTAFPSELCVGSSGQAWFSFVSAEPAEVGDLLLEHSNLLCYLDISLGHGVAIWHCDSLVGAEMAAAGKGGVDENMWVSLASHAPYLTGEVLLDPWTGTVADPRSVLTFTELRTVVEEFCYTGSGFRPESIQWAPGHPTGELF